MYRNYRILENQSTPSIDDIAESLRKIKVQTVAPVDLWSPEFCGNLDIRIAKDGSWFHEGSKINRTKLVQLFASILKKEGDKYFLVTPVEKIGINVDFAPFVATTMTLLGGGRTRKISFTTNIGETFELSYQHRLRIDYNPETSEPHPYVVVRQNLEALIDRKSFYRLVDLGCIEKYQCEDWFGVWSNNCFFPIIRDKYLPK